MTKNNVKIAITQELMDRFWAKVKKGPQGECWEWTGAKNTKGYGRIAAGYGSSSRYLAHRLAYEEAVGPILPNICLDHVCHNPSCVNPTHLRACTIRQNNSNQCLRKSNACGYKGVHAYFNKWIAQITVNRKNIYIGLFKTKEEAHAAYCDAATRYFGEFANFGGVA